jgi:TonB-linked SusC/RagA family outer membrane protein
MELKIAFLIIVTGISGAFAAPSYSQVTKVSLDMKGTTLEQVMDEIERQSEFYFIFNQKQVDVNRIIDVQAENKLITDILPELLSGTNVNYAVLDRKILLTTDILENGIGPKAFKDKLQQKQITGTVTDESGNLLPGVTIIVKGTNVGTLTDASGKFLLLNVPDDAVLIFSFVGMKSKEIEIERQLQIEVTMETSIIGLDDVVVTALAIEKSTKALGFSVQKVEGKIFEKTPDPNLLNSLTGKIAGLVVNTSAEMFVSSSMQLRGANPLIIMDGVSTSLSWWEINSNDIESISVLKGASASALYGSAGGNGAILITSKKGNRGKTRVEINSNLTFQPWLLTSPRVQTEFGTGNNGVYEYVNGTGTGIEGGGFAWGPLLDGRLIKQWNSPIDPETGERIPIPWIDRTGGKGNLVKFLDVGHIATNNINVETGNEKGNFRMSITNTNQKGIVPNTNMNILGFSLAGDYQLSDKIKINSTLNYSKQTSPNYRVPGYSSIDYIYSLVFWLGADIDLEDAKNYWEPGKEGIQQRFQQTGYYNNPYLILYENLHSWDKGATYGQLTATYDIFPNLQLMIRSGFNSNALEKTERFPKSMLTNVRGNFLVDNTIQFRINTDAMLIYDKRINDLLQVNSIIGFSNIFDQMKLTSAKTDGLNVPELYTLKNSINPVINNNTLTETQTNSIYANITLNIWKPFYLSLTGRNDWVSTLPVSHNSFFYPSVSFAYVISEMFKMPSIIDLLKIRASWAQVNSGLTGSTYGQIQTYTISSFNSMPMMYSGGVYFPSDLRPSGTKTYELGGIIGFLKNRVSIDFTYFNKLSYDNIITMPVSIATGYSSVKANGREYMRNGIEVIALTKPLIRKNFVWGLDLNWSTTHEYLKSLEDGKERDGYIFVNKRVDQYYKIGWERSPDGQLIINGTSGLPTRDKYNRFAGYSDPDFTFGIQNSFTYKNLTLQFAVDGRYGGKYITWLKRMARAGTSTNYDYQLRLDAANGLKNFVADGVVVVSGNVEYDFDGNIINDTRQFAPNTTPTSYQDWMKTYYNMNTNNSDALISADYLKLRDLSLTYALPSTLIGRTFLKSAKISLIGNNLLIITRKESKGDDPSFQNVNLKSPTPVNLGFNLNLTF